MENQNETTQQMTLSFLLLGIFFPKLSFIITMSSIFSLDGGCIVGTQVHRKTVLMLQNTTRFHSNFRRQVVK